MKKLLPALALLMLVFGQFSCLKDNSCNNKSVASERTRMLSFAADNGLTVTEHSSGLMYQIVNPGAGQTPNIYNTVACTYTGSLLNGTVFDSQTSTPIPFPLNGVIAGWQIGIPLIAEGGTIRLIVPSSLAYGCTGYGSIGGDEILYFEVHLNDVQ